MKKDKDLTYKLVYLEKSFVISIKTVTSNS